MPTPQQKTILAALQENIRVRKENPDQFNELDTIFYESWLSIVQKIYTDEARAQNLQNYINNHRETGDTEQPPAGILATIKTNLKAVFKK